MTSRVTADNVAALGFAAVRLARSADPDALPRPAEADQQLRLTDPPGAYTASETSEGIPGVGDGGTRQPSPEPSGSRP